MTDWQTDICTEKLDKKLDKTYKIIILLYQSYIILMLVESLCGEFESVKSDTPSLRPISGKNLSDVKLLKLLLCEVGGINSDITFASSSSSLYRIAHIQEKVWETWRSWARTQSDLQSVQITFNTIKKFKRPQVDRRRWSPLIYWHTTSLSFIMTTSRK